MVDKPVELLVIVQPDGTVTVSADRVASYGLRPGDRLRLVPSRPRRRRSMLGAASASSGFTDADLADVRHEMAVGLGDDLQP
jgi:hypothetical protein